MEPYTVWCVGLMEGQQVKALFAEKTIGKHMPFDLFTPSVRLAG